MDIKAVLFDLDGTLLPMDLEVFVKAYFKGLAKRLAPHGYDPNKLVETIWAGTAAMVKNTGERTNEEVFWTTAAKALGKDLHEDEKHFDAFYREGFDALKETCGYDPRAAETVRAIKAKGYRVALATNPIFPAIATRKRIAWTGLSHEEFELYTTYENSHYCKPELSYYEEVLNKMGVRGEECLMVGNDVEEDMVARKLGMRVFLLTDCIINKRGEDISVYPHGSFEQLMEYIEKT